MPPAERRFCAKASFSQIHGLFLQKAFSYPAGFARLSVFIVVAACENVNKKIYFETFIS